MPFAANEGAFAVINNLDGCAAKTQQTAVPSLELDLLILQAPTSTCAVF